MAGGFVPGGLGLVDQAFELGQLAAAERIGGGEFGVHGVDLFAVDQDFIMQVRAGGAAGGADIADDLALGDFAAVFQAFFEAVEVGVGGAVFFGVFDADEVAAGAFGAQEGDNAVTAGFDGSADRGGKVGSAVHFAIAEDGVAAQAEIAGDTGEFERGAEEQFALGFAFFVEIFAIKVVGAAGFFADFELGGENFAGFDALA